MKKHYITSVIIHDDGSKTVHMHPMSKSWCVFTFSLRTILPYLTIIVVAALLFWFLLGYKVERKASAVCKMESEHRGAVVTNMIMQCTWEMAK